MTNKDHQQFYEGAEITQSFNIENIKYKFDLFITITVWIHALIIKTQLQTVENKSAKYMTLSSDDPLGKSLYFFHITAKIIIKKCLYCVQNVKGHASKIQDKNDSEGNL